MRPLVRLTTTLTTLLPLLCTATTALADAPRAGAVRLVYERQQGAESCPDEAGFRDVVAARVSSGDPFVTQGGETQISVTIARTHDARFEAELTLSKASGEQLGTHHYTSTDSCLVLTEDIATSITVMLLPPSSTHPFSPHPLPPPPLPPPPLPPSPLPPISQNPPPSLDRSSNAPAPRAPAPSAPLACPDMPRAPAPRAPLPAEPVRQSELRWQFGMGAGVPLGSAPGGATAGAMAIFGIRWRHFSVLLEGRSDMAVPLQVPALHAAIDVSLHAGTLSLCSHRQWLFGCGVMTVGLINGSPAELTSVTHSRLRMEAGARVGAEIPIFDKLTAQLTMDVQGVMRRPEVLIGPSPAWVAAQISAFPALRLIASF